MDTLHKGDDDDDDDDIIIIIIIIRPLFSLRNRAWDIACTFYVFFSVPRSVRSPGQMHHSALLWHLELDLRSRCRELRQLTIVMPI
jgi:hypothetical protein